jgi:hypothetical protein
MPMGNGSSVDAAIKSGRWQRSHLIKDASQLSNNRMFICLSERRLRHHSGDAGDVFHDNIQDVPSVVHGVESWSCNVEPFLNKK